MRASVNDRARPYKNMSNVPRGALRGAGASQRTRSRVERLGEERVEHFATFVLVATGRATCVPKRRQTRCSRDASRVQDQSHGAFERERCSAIADWRSQILHI